ncbi:MAG: ABC transporter ATP-binding protein [Desulfurococcales archaeon]|nr:ABC transporter ATP-binding protein [Desulfurococcales archaeon]
MEQSSSKAALMRGVYKYVLRNASFTADEGVYALVGPNGSGKTTLLRLLAGAIAPERGIVRVYGGDPFRDHKVRMVITYSASRPLAEGLEHVKDYLNLYYKVLPSNTRWMEPRAALRELGIEGLYGERIYSLSEGQKRRVELAKLLLSRSKVKLIDEPTTFLDEEARGRVIDLLRRLAGEGLTIIATHDRELLEKLRPTIIMLEAGRIVKVAAYDEASETLETRRVYLLKARVKTRNIDSLDVIRNARGVRRASYNLDLESLLDKLGLGELKHGATSISIITPEEARRLAETERIAFHTISGVEVEATIEAEVYAEGLSDFIDFLMERFTVEELTVSSPIGVAEA